MSLDLMLSWNITPQEDLERRDGKCGLIRRLLVPCGVSNGSYMHTWRNSKSRYSVRVLTPPPRQ